ncbi:MAG: hypothetical protein CVU42_06135 [Chloroflexi bacterium HGW-Chloroflexi-4]|jgi:hypothetical protein|nr:MAG: hypothetical protein CVU42_06135 [Chloroflexi bacterium HGW-Chloroflexi-4]
MKKIIVPVIIVVFGVCAFFGYKVASKILSTRQTSNIQTEQTTDIPLVSQSNFIFIHVNDLSLEKPELVSIWVGFVNQSLQSQMMVLPIFPTLNAEVHDQIIQKFSINSENKINQRWINQIQSSFDIKIDGYILTDDIGVGLSNQWITGKESLTTTISAKSDFEKHTILVNGQNSWQQFCTLVNTGTANSFFSAINWGLLLPDHFSTNLDFESLTLLADNIVHANGQVQCEVLSNE